MRVNSQGAPDIYHGPDDWSDWTVNTPKEEFADMFLNWAFDSFANDRYGAGANRYAWMSSNMSVWIDKAKP